MSRWMVNVRGQQFSAGDMNELRKLAKTGALTGGDIVQPPGASEWIYALEVPELKGLLRADAAGDMDLPAPPSEMNPVVKWGLAAVLGLVAVVSWAYALDIASDAPAAEDLELISEKGLSYSEVLVTSDPAPMYASDNASGQQLGQLPKNSEAELLAKRGQWYKVRAGGAEGYVKITDVIPAFFFADTATQEKYKPLYYPDQYVQIQNSSWSTVPADAKKGPDLTSFLFMIGNTSGFPMTDIRLKAIIKDGAGKTLEELEIPVQGTLPPNDSNFVGMLAPDPKDKSGQPAQIMLSSVYAELSKTDPEVSERWTDGVEVKLQSQGFTNAEIQLVEVRAVAPGQAAN